MYRFNFETSGKTRNEHDLLGDKEVPIEALFGVQTLRCCENFNISVNHLCDYPEFIKALGMVKMAAIKANYDLGLVSKEIRDSIVAACEELIEYKHVEQFPIDMIQGGAGTSVNMNANEVIANRALEIMGKERGQYEFCHPNDHVNMAQSTNDAYPCAMHLGIYFYHEIITKNLQILIDSFAKKQEEFKDVVKMGRTQLQDAVPMTMGQTFGAFKDAMKHEFQRLNYAAQGLLSTNMGATAIGTGITAEPGYAEKCTDYLKEISGLPVFLEEDLVEATHDTSSMVIYSGVLKHCAIRLSKICNDLRMLSSGPRCGLNEINLPARQPGSSIMPGKVNPVIPEVVNQICFKVIGNDMAVCMASEAAQLELNVMEPVLVESVVESADWLGTSFRTLAEFCINGITANKEHCKQVVKNSIGIVTALKPYIGYAACTKIAKEAQQTGKGVYELVLEQKILSEKNLHKILDPANMVKPTIVELDED
ncbi:MAG: aspartate ammonia-lyase [Bacteroidales bacterium]